MRRPRDAAANPAGLTRVPPGTEREQASSWMILIPLCTDWRESTMKRLRTTRAILPARRERFRYRPEFYTLENRLAPNNLLGLGDVLAGGAGLDGLSGEAVANASSPQWAAFASAPEAALVLEPAPGVTPSAGDGPALAIPT